jgi:hypothetical protein
MAGRDSRLENSHPQAWARPLSRFERKSSDQPEIISVTNKALCSGSGLFSHSPAGFLCVSITHGLPERPSSHLRGLESNERNSEPESLRTNHTIRASRILPSQKEKDSGSPNQIPTEGPP